MPRKNNSRAAAAAAEQQMNASLAASLDDMDNSGEEEIMVDSIEGIRMADGVIQYWVHWLHYDQKDNTWEPRENLTNCHDQLMTFHRLCDEQKQALAPPKRPNMKSIPSGVEEKSAAKKKIKGINGTGEWDDDEAGPRDSVSSSISNQNGRKGRSNKGKSGKTTIALEKLPPPLKLSESDDEELPLGGRHSRSASDGDRSRSISAGAPTRGSASLRNPVSVKLATKKTPARSAVNDKSAASSSSKLSTSDATPKRSAASKPSRRLSESEEEIPMKEEPRGRSRKAQETAKPAAAEPQPKKAKSSSTKKEPAKSKAESSEGEGDEEDVPQGMYAVDAVLGALVGNDSKNYYLIKWYGYDLKDCTWETGKAVSQSRGAVNEFYKKYGKPSNKNQWKVLSPEGQQFEQMSQDE